MHRPQVGEQRADGLSFVLSTHGLVRGRQAGVGADAQPPQPRQVQQPVRQRPDVVVAELQLLQRGHAAQRLRQHREPVVRRAEPRHARAGAAAQLLRERAEARVAEAAAVDAQLRERRAAAAAATAGLRATLYDKGCITNSLTDYPYYMTFFSTAQKLEIGDVPFTIADSKPTRREALGYYRRVVRYYGLDVRQYEEVTSVEGQKGDFLLHTKAQSGAENTLRARALVVATGGFHEPNYLNVPGEDLPKVKHYYQEPFHF